MPSEPTKVPQENSSTQITPATQTPSLQHGFQGHDERAPHFLPTQEDRDEPSYSISEAHASAESAEVATHLDKNDEGSLRRMRSDSSPRTRSPVDRISEYESATTVSPKRDGNGPGFRIVEKSKKTRDNRLLIATFPNGMLSYDTLLIKDFMLICLQKF